MKKLLGIIALTTLCLISYANIGYAEAAKCKKGMILKDGKCQFDYGKYLKKSKKKNERKKFFKNITGLTYFEKRKDCKDYADRAYSVYIGKQRYKNCMEN